MKSKEDNFLKFHKLHHVNSALVVFLFIFLYVMVCIYLSSKESNIVGYQVKNGKLAENRIYNGIAIRDENVVNSSATGYAALFLSEGERAAYKDVVYAIDESGKIADLIIKDPGEESSLKAKDMDSLKQRVMLFSKEFDESLFEDALIFEDAISDEIKRLENRQLFVNVEEVSNSHVNDVINYYQSGVSGIVSYYKDGFEGKKPDELTKEDFDTEKYSAEYVFNDSFVEAGNFIYKYTNNENWQLCIFVPNEELSRIKEDDYLDVRFLKTQTNSWGNVHIVKNLEDGAIVSLSFTNSMVSFVKDRFVEIELLIEEDTGLKVPNTSITDNTFFLIDKDFIQEGVNDANYGVNRQAISDSGSVTVKFTEVNVVKKTDDYYYVQMSGLSQGDVLYYVESEKNNYNKDHDQTFVVGKQGTLKGVYNINKGYADFKQIDILYSNDEYSIIKSASVNGLRAYDYIALDASVVTDKDFVY